MREKSSAAAMIARFRRTGVNAGSAKESRLFRIPLLPDGEMIALVRRDAKPVGQHLDKLRREYDPQNREGGHHHEERIEHPVREAPQLLSVSLVEIS